MKEKPTRKKKNVTITISDTDRERARFIMNKWDIPSFSLLVRELIDEMYFYLMSKETTQEDGQEDHNDTAL